MKIYYKFLTISALFSLVFSSCINEDSLLNTEESTHTFEINASLASLNEEDETTRSSITSNVVVEWTKDAAISVINLSTKKVLGGNLVAQKAGTNTTFVGTATGSISAGDKLVFIYPAKNIAAEKTLESSDFVYDLFGSQTTTTPFVAKYTYTVPNNSKDITLSNADFTFLSAYLKMNLSTLPGNTEVTNVTIENMGTALSCIPNSDYSDLTATGTLGDINIDLSTTTKEKGYVVVKFSSAPSAKQEQERTVIVTCGDDEYVSSIVSNEIKSNAYVNVNVTAFEKYKFVRFGDANFKAYMVENFDIDGDGEISFEEAEVVTKVEVINSNINSLKGVECFKNLTFLNCGFNKLTTLNVSKNTALSWLDCGENKLTSLDVNSNTKLTCLDCSSNQLASLDVSTNTELIKLFCSKNELTSVDVTKNTELGLLNCHDNQLTSLDITKNTKLEILNCDNNELTTIDVTQNTKLREISCCNNNLSMLNLTNNTALTELYCTGNQLSTLDVTKNTKLKYLSCNNNPFLTTIYISDGQTFNTLYKPEGTILAAKPLTFTSKGNTSIMLYNVYRSSLTINLEYKKGLDNWQEYTMGTSIDLEDGESLQFRASAKSNITFYLNYNNCSYFKTSGNGTLEVSGNIMSLLDNTLQRKELTDYSFRGLFMSCQNIVDASDLVLPTTILADGCYMEMFRNCKNLEKAPKLPATTLAESCYYSMFEGCTSLTTTPELPATQLAKTCYDNMFKGCSSLSSTPKLQATTMVFACYYGMFEGCSKLNTTPELNATQLAESCYMMMFKDCTSLASAPNLPATNLELGCYSYMFEGCTNLTTAPVLPASTLKTNCYNRMFKGCSKLNYVKALFTSTPTASTSTFDTNCNTTEWLYGVSTTGTFVKSKQAKWDIRGDYAIPAEWTIETE